MRTIIDTKTMFTLYEDIEKEELNFPLLSETYMRHCYGRDAPDRMEVTPKMFEYLDKFIFNNHPEFAGNMKFRNARVIIMDLYDSDIRFVRIAPCSIPRKAYQMNGFIRVNK